MRHFDLACSTTVIFESSTDIASQKLKSTLRKILELASLTSSSFTECATDVASKNPQGFLDAYPVPKHFRNTCIAFPGSASTDGRGRTSNTAKDGGQIKQ